MCITKNPICQVLISLSNVVKTEGKEPHNFLLTARRSFIICLSKAESMPFSGLSWDPEQGVLQLLPTEAEVAAGNNGLIHGIETRRS